jgi:hypothetical protein
MLEIAQGQQAAGVTGKSRVAEIEVLNNFQMLELAAS